MAHFAYANKAIDDKWDGPAKAVMAMASASGNESSLSEDKMRERSARSRLHGPERLVEIARDLALGRAGTGRGEVRAGRLRGDLPVAVGPPHGHGDALEVECVPGRRGGEQPELPHAHARVPSHARPSPATFRALSPFGTAEPTPTTRPKFLPISRNMNERM